MAHRIGLTFVVSGTFSLFFWPCPSLACEPQQAGPGDVETLTGIVVDCISPAQLRTWQSIVDIIEAKDNRGQLLHPTLHGLYYQANTSGHLIRIELSEEESLTRAGRFIIDKADSGNQHHEVRIRLNLATIRRTHVGEDVRHANGLIPFAGLGTKKRYAEVLGHELAHAVAVFKSIEMLRLYQLLEKETADLDSGGPNAAEGDRLRCLERIEQLQRRIEEPAETAELVIWRELSK